VTALAFTSDGTSLASAGTDYKVRLWDVCQGRQARLLSGFGKAATSLAFTADSRLLACGSGDNFVYLFDLTAERPEPIRVGPHPSGPRALSFSPDGRTLAICGRDRMVRLWEVSTRREDRKSTRLNSSHQITSY